ncbi:MAG TPA: BrnT family toxin [Allosphingosinicella sp.]|nr:BrnT family toxin [Allosphingosinicella sp.]
MIVDFDPAKDEANRRKHGVPLAFGARVFEDANHVILPSLRPVDGEDRYKAVGMVDGRLWTAIHVWRGETVRMISVRRSNQGEQGNHDRDPGRSG